jgi:hypothetical protein
MYKHENISVERYKGKVLGWRLIPLLLLLLLLLFLSSLSL